MLRGSVGVQGCYSFTQRLLYLNSLNEMQLRTRSKLLPLETSDDLLVHDNVFPEFGAFPGA